MSSSATIKLTWDQIDAIVIEELKLAIDLNLILDKDEGGAYIDPDWTLIEALEKALEYYMPHSEFDVYKRNLALQKVAVITELFGGYNDERTP